mgnify:CR=1 FL=1
MLIVETLGTVIGTEVSFALPDGRCQAVRGPSGSGKTRVLRAIADLDTATGRVSLDGTLREDLTAPEWRRRVRYVAAETSFWSPCLRDDLTSLGVGLAARLGLGAELLDQPVDRLSTGQRQRGALVRAMCDAPRVLLLDEPTATLDTVAASRVEEVLRAYMAQGGSIVLVTHDDDQAARLADQTLELSVP